MPTILEYLGYDPFPEPVTLSQRLVAKRRQKGWSIKEAAGVLGVDPSSWGNWECGHMILYRQHRALVAQLLDLSADALNQEMALRWNRSHKRAH